MELVADIASWLLIGSGSALALLGAIGVLCMPDVFSRMHAAGLIDTGGGVLILAGLAIQGGLTIVTVKLLLIIGFLLFTCPTTTHALAAAAIADGVKPKAKRIGKPGP